MSPGSAAERQHVTTMSPVPRQPLDTPTTCRPAPAKRSGSAAVAALAGRYGVEFDFASVPQLLARHGLRLQ
jgi:hypothetical protein